MSKQELFASPAASWALRLGRSIAIDRVRPAPSSIKSAVEAVHNGELLLVFPSGSRNLDAFKRGAATIALHAQAPLVPAHYKGPKDMLASHAMGRPRIEVRFGPPISTAGMAAGKAAAISLTAELYRSIEGLRCAAAG